MIREIKNIGHLCEAIIANILYGFPSKQLHIIGVTGTDGKTTTSALIYHILTSAGRKTSVLTTVFAHIGNTIHKEGLHITNPNPFKIQKYLKTAANDGHEFFVMETTSHSLHQHKMYGITFKAGIVTNITHDHLDYHITYENYVKAKVILLENSENAIINRDDKSFDFIKKYFSKPVITYGLKGNADVNFDISEKIGKPLAEYNKYNFLAAYTACKQVGLSDEEIFAGMKTYQLPRGRFEVVHDGEFKVVVDYAHTPNAFIELLKGVKDLLVKDNGRIIHIFGATGHRDKLKRPILGESSAQKADLVILTEEDPETEDPVELAYVIAEGLKRKNFTEVDNNSFGKESKTFTVIADRRKAIEKGVEIAKPGDVIVLTGMGHQTTMVKAEGEVPWVEQEIVKETIQKIKTNTVR